MASADILRAAHSPLPWALKLEGLRSKPQVVCPDPEDADWPWIVAKCEGDALNDKTGKDNAAFIVRACNAHYELLAALKIAQSTLAMLTEPDSIRSSTVSHAWAQAVAAERTVRAAIAAAEAEAGR